MCFKFDISWSLVLLGGLFLGTAIKTYFKITGEGFEPLRYSRMKVPFPIIGEIIHIFK